MSAESDYKNVSKPIQMSAAARVIGIHYRHLARLAEQGWVKKEPGFGLVKLTSAVQGYVKSLKDSTPTRNSMRTELVDMQRQKLALQIRSTAGELLPIAMVDETIQGMSVEFVSLLEGLPSRLANELAGISEPAVVREHLLDEVRRIRSVVAKHLEQRAEALKAMHDSGKYLAASAEKKTMGMGGGESDLPAGERGAGPIQDQTDSILQTDPGRVRRSKVSKSRRGNGHANGKDRIFPQRHRKKAR